MQRVLRAAAIAAAVMAVSVGAYAVTDGSGDPAAVKSDDGKWSDKNDIPTFKIEPDGTVDWYTYVGFTRYSSECLRCHGPDGMGSSYAPALMEFDETPELHRLLCRRGERQEGCVGLAEPGHAGQWREQERHVLSSMRSTSTCARAQTMPSDEGVRRSMRRSLRRSPRPRTNAWVDRNRPRDGSSRCASPRLRSWLCC